jgi:hypothetical protein
MSIRDNLEYGGFIYRKPNGRYGYTLPKRGENTSFNPNDAVGRIPRNGTIVGDYHTHGDYSLLRNGKSVRTGDPARDDFNSDNFSFDDYTAIRHDGTGISGYKGYLGTPSGVFKSYDPSTRTTSTL